MATNYPTSIDSFTNPTSGDTLDSPSHAAQHANINDAMVAVQTKLGTGAGTIGEWTSYTPSINNFTINDTAVADYCRVNDLVFYRFSTSSVASVSARMEVSLPVTAATITHGTGSRATGTSFAYDSSLGDTYYGFPTLLNTTTMAVWYLGNTPAYWGDTAGTYPFAWANTDDFRFFMIYRAA